MSTFGVNVVGCFVIGVLAALVEHHDLFSPSVRLLSFTGLLGGFTTFSAFGYESVFLLRRGLMSIAASYVILSVTCGLGAVFVGIKLIDQFWPPASLEPHLRRKPRDRFLLGANWRLRESHCRGED